MTKDELEYAINSLSIQFREFAEATEIEVWKLKDDIEDGSLGEIEDRIADMECDVEKIEESVLATNEILQEILKELRSGKETKS